MKKIIIAMTLLLTLTACGSEETTADPEGDTMIEAVYRKITPEEAKEMMVEGNIILDVRTEGEYADGHIEGSTLLPLDQIQAGNLELLPDKDQVILVYCRSGNRSGQAANILINAGYTGIYDFGGINDWPYDIVK